MHKYSIKLTKYSEEGALTNEVKLLYCDTPQQLYEQSSAYDKQRYYTSDEEGHAIPGMKMWKVECLQAGYSVITDFEEFCNVNAVLR